MSIKDLKITDNAIAKSGVVAAPDKLTGSASENKKIFDRLIREVVKSVVNQLIDELTSTQGAANIGTATIDGLPGDDVQSKLYAIKQMLDSKESTSAAKDNIRDVEFIPATGVIRFIKADGSSISIDTAMEKISTNWRYDRDKQSIILTLADGSEQEVPLGDFITETEFSDSDQISFSVSGHKITATVKSGSIMRDMLDSAVFDELIRLETTSAAHANEAAAILKEIKELNWYGTVEEYNALPVIYPDINYFILEGEAPV